MLQSRPVSPNAQVITTACKWRVWRVRQTKFSRRLKSLATVLAEYRRAIAAVRRYEELKLHREAVVGRHNIPRRIFEEFYSRMDADCIGGGDNATKRCENQSSRRFARWHLLAGLS
jgi:hypothetical protein